MRSIILAAVAAVSLMYSRPASAAIIQYEITFNDPDGTGPKTGGSGILTLNETVAGNLNQDAPTLGESFVGTVDGLSFNINSSNFFQWHINLGSGTSTIWVFRRRWIFRWEASPTSTSSEAEVTTFYEHGAPVYCYGTYTIGPGIEISTAAPVPLGHSTWPMLILGFLGLGFMAYRRRSEAALMAV